MKKISEFSILLYTGFYNCPVLFFSRNMRFAGILFEKGWIPVQSAGRERVKRSAPQYCAYINSGVPGA